MSEVEDIARLLHHDVWKALRRVARGEAPGSPELREALFDRKLATWNGTGLKLTDLGKAVLKTRAQDSTR